jgi:hypothetical protein
MPGIIRQFRIVINTIGRALTKSILLWTRPLLFVADTLTGKLIISACF